MHYLRYWSLRYPPFTAGANRFYFATAARQAAIAKIHRCVVQRETYALMVSPAGSGVTTFMNHLAQFDGFGDCATKVVCTNGGKRSWLSLAAAMEVRTPFDLRRAFAALAEQSVRMLWLIDHCQRREIEWLERFEFVGSNVTVIAAVTTTDGSTNHRDVEIPMGVLTRCETGAFLGRSLRAAGCLANVFDESGIDEIHRLSAGRFRVVRELAERCLVVAATRHQRLIRRDDVGGLVARRNAA